MKKLNADKLEKLINRKVKVEFFKTDMWSGVFYGKLIKKIIPVVYENKAGRHTDKVEFFLVKDKNNNQGRGSFIDFNERDVKKISKNKIYLK